MNETNPVFENKRERNDFFTALAVIAFFMLMYALLTGNNIMPNMGNIKDQALASIGTEKVDSDGDGIPDDQDLCPALAGNLINKGCPPDGDSDGVYDNDDDCPKFAGTAANNGCPPDSDGDGVHDGIDKCKKLVGTAANNGCPPDSDGDGVYDKKDKCPKEAGPKSNDGCPVIKKADKIKLATSAEAVEFETGKAVLKTESVVNLSSIAKILKKYPNASLSISGHTDNKGVAENNQKLSAERAKACKKYLESVGVSSKRMSARGFGQTRPRGDNSTPEGRQKNRRVEFKISYK